MKSSELLREAAKLVDSREERFCCFAINAVWARDRPQSGYYEAMEYLRLFQPNDPSGYWWPIAHRKPRVIALQLAADIAESEGH